MKFNTEITVKSPLTNETTKWQGPQIEAETFRDAVEAANYAEIFVTGENVPREALSVKMQPPRSLAFVKQVCNENNGMILKEIVDSIASKWMFMELDDSMSGEILSAIGFQVFNPLDPETIRMRNQNLFHPAFLSKLDEAEAIGGVVISYLPEV